MDFKLANIIFWGYILLLFGGYIALRILTKAIALSWFEVKLTILKEVHNGEEKRKEKEGQSGEKS
jgi:hypothetical protein